MLEFATVLKETMWGLSKHVILEDVENSGKSIIIRALWAKDAKTKYFVCLSNLWENTKHIKPIDHFFYNQYSIRERTCEHFISAVLLQNISTKVHNDAMMD